MKEGTISDIKSLGISDLNPENRLRPLLILIDLIISDFLVWRELQEISYRGGRTRPLSQTSIAYKVTNLQRILISSGTFADRCSFSPRFICYAIL